VTLKITVKAPSSTANLGPGFDVFGLAIDAFHDEVTLTKTKSGITIITDDSIPNPVGTPFLILISTPFLILNLFFIFFTTNPAVLFSGFIGMLSSVIIVIPLFVLVSVTWS